MADRILFLQRTIGNQAVGRLIKSGALQAKLKIGQPRDEYEQEADRVADRVMRMPSPVQKKCQKCEDEMRRQPEKEKEEEKTLQAKEVSGSTSEVTPELESHINSLRGGGQPLPESVRSFFEPRFEYNFSQVRVHTDAKAADSARAVNAQAYTVGQDVVFGERKYLSGTNEGQRLLAHELTHVVQQRHGMPGTARSLFRNPDTAAATPVSVDPELDLQWTIELRRRAGDRMNLAFTNYRSAITKVQEEMKKKEAQPTLLEQLITVGIGWLAPAVAGMVIGRLKDELKSVASVAIGAALKGKDDIAIKGYMKAEELVDKYIALDGDRAKSGYLTLAGAVKKPTTVPTGSAGRTVPVISLLNQLAEDFSIYLDELNAQIGNAERSAILGVFAAYNPSKATENLYVSQIRDLVSKHEEVAKYAENETAGPFGPAFDYRRIVLLEAWGVKKPAFISYSPLSILASKKAYWSFEKWVPPEVEQTAIAAGKGQIEGSTFKRHVGLQEVKVGEPYDGELPIQGHISDPRSEGERIVEIDAWGQLRLCRVFVQGEGGKFLGWISSEEQEFARVQGLRQPGGVLRMNADKITDMKIPQ